MLETAYKWQEAGETIAFTNGVFDILHRGHVHSLETAATLADRLVVGVNSDRSACIAAMAVVDLVVLFDEPTPYELLSELKPDVLVKGSEYKIEEVAGREFAGKVELIDRIDGLSTTELLAKIRGS